MAEMEFDYVVVGAGHHTQHPDATLTAVKRRQRGKV